jgi:hypothetical protein
MVKVGSPSARFSATNSSTLSSVTSERQPIAWSPG